MSIYPKERDELAEQEHYNRLDAKIERKEDERIEKKLKEPTMNIKDFIHLYLGCECWWEDKDGNSGGRTEIDFYIIAELYGERIKLKPILRPLSDMTKEERKECGNLDYDFSDDEIFNNMDWKYFDTLYSANQVIWLLSKHFDLFGLIDSGLAIDKTTFK